MSETLIKVENISKKFCLSTKHTMLYGTTDIIKGFVGARQDTEQLRKGEFWAINDISFELKRGETLGLIGANGSGKSTLLKLLNGIFMPDKGRIEINGRLGALIEVGAGFHPMLTGRENIYINGSILGFKKKEIDQKLDAIIDFSELHEFIDTPVRHYSSGMHVRLGFAIAAQMKPDVLLIDEVLAVGDVGFRAKCINAINEISKSAAVIFVSHQMQHISRICSDVCVMQKGHSKYIGDKISHGIELYFSKFERQEKIISGSGKATINNISLEDHKGKETKQINYLDSLTINLLINVESEIKRPVIYIGFLTQESRLIAHCCSEYNNVTIHNTGETMNVLVTFPEMNFNPGIYAVSIAIYNEEQTEILTHHFSVKELRISGVFVGVAPIQLNGKWTTGKQQNISISTNKNIIKNGES